MAADVVEKADRYERLLAAALKAAEPVSNGTVPDASDAAIVEEMARSYLDDGRHFADQGDPVNALAAYAYGHGWLDAGARLGLFDVPENGDLFTV